MDRIDRDDLKAAIKNCDYNYHAFEIKEKNELSFHWRAYLNPDWEHAPPSEVTICYKKTGKGQYDLAGNEIPLTLSNAPKKWIREFIQDLQAHYFE